MDPATLGLCSVQHAIETRRKQLDLSELEYLRLVQESSTEFVHFVNQIVVPETWFFRGGEVFTHIAEVIRQVMNSRTTPFRVLSLPCSTGEEPYSLAIALTERGVPQRLRSIDGVDLSSTAIEAARRGIYGELSFRQTTPELKSRYFRIVPGGLQLDPLIRESVQFQVGNLLDPGLLLWQKPYDLVFCRNLFIYFSPEARQRGLTVLVRLVTPGGLLAVGHAESIPATDTRFERTGPLGCFLYRRTREGIA